MKLKKYYKLKWLYFQLWMFTLRFLKWSFFRCNCINIWSFFLWFYWGIIHTYHCRSWRHTAWYVSSVKTDSYMLLWVSIVLTVLLLNLSSLVCILPNFPLGYHVSLFFKKMMFSGISFLRLLTDPLLQILAKCLSLT